MKQNYIKPQTKIIELDTLDMFMCGSEEEGQILAGCAKAHSFIIDDEEDWSDFEDNDFQK